jgi:hypothetical protein
MRKFSIPFLAALVIVALFWGNCLSCPQLLLVLNSHGCCHHAKIDCQSPGLSHFVKADAGAQAPALSTVAIAPAIVATLLPDPISAPIPAEHAPPDLLSLRI